MELNDLARQLEAPDVAARLAAVRALCELERNGGLGPARPRIGPVLPSYDHVHTRWSYGDSVPGVCSVSRVVWAAHEARAPSVFLVEHESLAHIDEATAAVRIVNAPDAQPGLRLALAIEFKALIDLDDPAARKLSEAMAALWGQGEAAWVVGVGATRTPELERLARQFREAKRLRAEQQLARLKVHLKLSRRFDLAEILTTEGNVTDRQFSVAVARAELGDAGDVTLARRGSEIRRMLNPGGPGHVPFPTGLPTYQELVPQLARWGMLPTSTAQLRGRAMAELVPALKSWGIAGLDVAGIEPTEPDWEQQIALFIDLAQRHGLALFGGSDYRGTGTGWQRHEAWMDHPFLRGSIDRVARLVT